MALTLFLLEIYQTVTRYSSPPLSAGDTFQDPQWMPGTTDSTKLYIYYVFSYTGTNGWVVYTACIRWTKG